MDSYDESWNFKPGEWRAQENGALHNMERLSGNRNKFSAETVRDTFKNYFNSKKGALSWQVNHVRDCGGTLASDIS